MDKADLLGRLPTMPLADLRQAWRDALGGEPPRFRTRDLLALALAHRLQVQRDGGLTAPVRRRLDELAQKFRDDRNFRPVAGPDLKPGSSLIKEWRGVRHEVRVLEAGYSYDGHQYRSLSEVAARITGAKWSGPLFFGLRQRAR